LEDLGVEGRIISELVLGKWCGKVATCCEHGNGPCGSTKGGEFVD
jgi:hypothetical protein